MKVGDYVRTNKGEIGKLKELKLNYTKGKRLVTYYTTREVEENFVMFDNKNITQRFVDGSCYYLTDDELKMVEESIIKSSPNIIDLIELGDLVRLFMEDDVDKEDTNTFEVVAIPNDRKTIGVFTGDFEIEFFPIENLRGIVTKEQFSQMEYRLEEK